jgi:hypothetical protein
MKSILIKTKTGSIPVGVRPYVLEWYRNVPTPLYYISHGDKVKAGRNS